MAKTQLHEIAAQVAKKNEITIKEAEKFVSEFFAIVREGLETDRQVKVRGLGTFKIVAVKPRESVNVNTGERVLIEGHDKITFTPDAGMKELVNKPFSQFDTVELEDSVDFADIPHETADIATVAEPIEEPEQEVVEERSIVEPEPVEEPEQEVVEEQPIMEPESIEEPKEEPETKQDKEPETKQEEPHSFEVEAKPNLKQDAEPILEQETEPTPDVEVENRSEHVLDRIEESAVEEPAEPAVAAPLVSEPADKKQVSWGMVLAFAALFILGLLVGLWLSKDHDKGTAAEPQEPIGVVADSALTDTVIVEEKVPDTQLDLEKLNADPRVKYGAYSIEGIDTIVTLRPGQTMESYCRATLGSNMLCYFQALNDTTELSGGDTMKVPKVKVKTRGK